MWNSKQQNTRGKQGMDNTTGDIVTGRCESFVFYSLLSGWSTVCCLVGLLSVCLVVCPVGPLSVVWLFSFFFYYCNNLYKHY